MKLSDAQFSLLRAASRRKDRRVVFPNGLKDASTRKIVAALLTNKLIKQMPGRKSRRNDRQTLFCVTSRGLKAIQSLRQGHRVMRTANPGKVRIESAGQKRESKQASTIHMLHRPEGVSIATIMQATGWQRHTVRGFFAAIIRKKFGLNLISEDTGAERVYRILGDVQPVQPHNVVSARSNVEDQLLRLLTNGRSRNRER